MKHRTTRVTAGLVVGAAVGLTSFTASSAFAVPMDQCDVLEGATQISEGICQILIATEDIDGDFANFELPAGVTKLSAVLVGGGGGGGAGYEDSFGGGAGGTAGFALTAAAPTSAATTLTVVAGAGGAGSRWAYSAPGVNGGTSSIGFDWNGSPTSFDANGGIGGNVVPETPGSSGNDFSGGNYGGGGAAGAGGDYSGGVGFATVGDLLAHYDLDENSLWADTSSIGWLDDLAYGGDGERMSGFGPDSNHRPTTPSPRGMGAGGTARSYDWNADTLQYGEDGEDGIVIVRFAYGDADVEPVAKISRNIVPQGAQLTVTVTDLYPNEEVELWAESKRVDFGMHTANGSGTLVFTFTATAANFPLGNHNFYVGRTGNPTLTLPFQVVMPETGASDAAPALLAAAGALGIAGVGLIALRRRRSKA